MAFGIIKFHITTLLYGIIKKNSLLLTLLTLKISLLHPILYLERILPTGNRGMKQRPKKIKIFKNSCKEMIKN